MRRGRIVGATLGASVVFASSASAATYTVTSSTDDAVPAPCTGTNCTTLRDALGAANADSSADTIVFQNGVSGAISLVGGALPLTGTHGITINGPGSGTLAVDAHTASQAFTVSGTPPSGAPGDAINGLTVENGKSSSAGGAIADTTTGTPGMPLSLSGDVIKNSTTSISASNYGGGGIFSASELTVSSSTVSGNTATGGSSHGGGIDVKDNALNVSNSTLSGNGAGDGGAIGMTSSSGQYFNNVISVSNSHITDNHASASNGYGGGILGRALEMTVSGSTFTGNTAPTSGTAGAIASETKYGTLITNSTLSGNSAGFGGAIASTQIPVKYSPFVLRDATVSGNQATDGAGLGFLNVSGGSAKIQRTTITGNHGGANSFGGGIDVSGYVQSAFDLVDSTVSGNSASNGGGVSLGDSSHRKLLGKYNHGGPVTYRTGSISFDNSTVASNSASNSGGGGGIYLGSYQYNSSAPKKSGTADIVSTVVSGDTAGGAAQDLARGAGSTSGGFNGAFSLIQSPGSAPLLSKNQVILGANPELGPLANNGGPTQTMLPAGTSPVIDQAHAESGLTTDQRGLPRTVDTSIPNPPGGDGTDIGAVELPASSVRGIGFSVSINSKQLGGRHRPLVGGSSTPIKCQVKASVIASCVVQIKVRNKLVASGANSTQHPGRSLTVHVSLTPAGTKMLRHHRLGRKATAFAVGGTPGAPSTLRGGVRLLSGPSFTLQGSGSGNLSKNVQGELDQIASFLDGVKKVKCAAFTSPGSVASTQAKAACKRLKSDGLHAKYKSVGKHATGANRRLVISFKF